MAFKLKKRIMDDADLDVTSFMNLMIVLVPVMLLSLTFKQITVLEINLPNLGEGDGGGLDQQGQLEVVIEKDRFDVFYPTDNLIKTIPLINEGKSYDFRQLTMVLQGVKAKLPERKDILIRAKAETDYQTLVSTMDSAKSYKTVVAASLVEIELFPQLSLAEAGEK